MTSSNNCSMDASSMPIAIIGIGLRFPGDGSDPEKFWQMLLDARSARSEIPKSRYSVDGFYHPDPNRLGVMNTKTAHFLKQDYKVFDAPFFSITPKEAKAMDPTHRMLLEVTYEGFENAGLSLDSVKGSKTSVYIGTFTNDFQGMQFRDNEGPSIYHATGLSGSLASNRLSWFYDLKGPSMTVDTACSSSLTAFHLACQSLRTGEAEMSVVGGSNLMFGPEMTILLGAAKILSPDGKSQMWDENANGFSRGEGVGITVLKPLADAIRDGDTVRAVVLASASNQDGRTPGISLPSSEAQEELIRTAYRQAGVSPNETGYVEAHGTGTQAGDPLEASAILNTIGHDRKTQLYVGSVKTNIGHLEGAAGVAGVIKAALLVERGLVPENLWFNKLNPQITLPDNVKVPQELCTWPTSGPRRASVNSFGFGGANAHVVLEDAAHYLERFGLSGRHSTVIAPRLPTVNGTKQLTNGNGHESNGEIHTNGATQYTNGNSSSNTQPEKPKVFVLSSSDREGVKRGLQNLSDYVRQKDQDSDILDSLAYTLGERRTILPWKTYAVASNLDGLVKSLAEAPAATRSSDSHVPKTAFIFTGQGAQWFAMGRELSIYDVYRYSLDYCEETLRSLGCKWSLSEELNRAQADCNLHLAEFSQPACTAIQIALVDLFQHWGVIPSAVAGHSSGEIAAAYCAGAISRDTALRIAWFRGQYAGVLAKKNLNGAMLAVSAGADDIRPKLAEISSGNAVVGCLNSPKACTVSGDKSAIDDLCTLLIKDQITYTKLNVDVAYHSPHMENIRDEYEAAISGFEVDSSIEMVPMFSSVTGSIVRPEELGPRYWVNNLTSPVNFTGAIKALLHHSEGQKRATDRAAFASIFLEVGPHSALRSYLLDVFKTEEKFTDLSYVNVLRRGHDGVQTVLAAVGQLYVKGCKSKLNLVNETSTTSKQLVDLPPYSWNHSVAFWQESYLSKQHRYREHPRLDLLGYPVPGAIEPQWRNFLRVSENPWIKEHCVQGNILYPGAGLMIMAIEGARQIADPNEEIIGYELRDVSISAALSIPDDDKGVETLVQFHPRRTGTKAGPSNTLNEFTVSSFSADNDQWQVHCRGLISVTTKSQITPAMEIELGLESQKYAAALNDAKAKCQKPVRSFLYDNVETIGMKYGPTFRNVTELYAGDNSSYGIIKVPDTKAIMPESFEYPAVIHPALLDSVLHILFPSISGPDQSLTEAVVPYAIDRLFVSANVPSTPNTELHGYSTATKASYTTWTSSITFSDMESHAPLVVMEGLGLASVGANDSQSQDTRAQCFETMWHEDSELMSPQHIKKLVHKRTIPNADDDSVLDKLEYVCLVYMQRILDWFNSEGKEYIPQSGFFKLYYEWIMEMMGSFPPLDSDPSKVDAAMAAARERISGSESGDITVQMVDRIGENLTRIFAKEIEPLQVMLEGDLLYTFYRGAFGTSFNTNVAEYVGLIADKQPGLSILEIGAGTGGTTYHVLERLRNEDGTSKAQKYVFTDISPGFLAKAAERFSKDASIMEFSTLNVEDDPMDQGFEANSFDLIVCANVLHATKSIGETLAHCHSLLKPGGKLVLSEVTIKRIFCGFIMGPLPGWWLGEDDGRKGGPLLDVQEWDIALKKADFSGVDIDIRGDADNSKEPVSLLISTKPLEAQPETATKYAIIGTEGVLTSRLSGKIQDVLQSHHLQSSVLEWGHFSESDIADTYCICLAELEVPILAQISDENWAEFRRLLAGARGTLWITSGAAMETSRPFGSLMVGLSRAIRNENANISLATLDIDFTSTVDMEVTSTAICKLAISHSRGNSVDHEYATRDGVIFVPRVTKAPGLNKQLLEYESQGDLEQVSFTSCGRPLKLTLKTPGLLDTFRFQEDEEYYKPMPEDWIEIQVKAVGLNFKDVLVAMGHLNEDKLGVDVSGVVTRIGTAVTGIAVGDRVMTSSCNTFATFVRFPALGSIPIPEGMSFEDAASMPLIYLTAYYALMTIGRLVKGETVLIHAAAGGVGQAAIVVAQHVGAEIFATVGSEEKKQLIMKEYGIPEDHIFSSRDLSFAKAIMRATNNVGVDVVLNSLAGEALRLSWHCLAKFGRFLEIGKADLFANTGLDMAPFLENKIYAGVNLIDFENNPTPRAVALFQEVGKLIRDGSISPVKPVMQFTFSDIEKAFRYMQTGKHSGKIVIRVDESDLVTAIPRTPQIEISANATYILAGGLGGICREIGRWLAEKGAENLVFLSRSAADGDENRAYIQGLKQMYGTNAMAFNCDVANRESLASVLKKCESLPPIRGVVTGAMVLRDTLFDSMTVEHLRITVGPKVHGTWNLHDMLPKDLDFFVMLSSLAGVMGHRGQGNYGAGNIFQDQFASFRRTQGLRAMTIDIGYLLSVGFVAEHDEYVDHVKSMGLKVMNNNDLHGLMSIAMKGTEAHPPQIMIGLPTNEYDDSWYWIRDGKFASLLNRAQGHEATTGSSIALSEELMKATDLITAVDIICGAIVEKLAKLMMVPASDIDPAKPLSTYGVDSLVAVEVRNWMAKELLVEISVFEIMANVPMRQLAVDLAGKSKLVTSD
ncbi:beta-ketoacyl synthase-containing protein [Coleophoma cylindrospora]|uniref:Beta-ketoacyl synthase-containing protein n=1 Tax=Coleophoma cylindrospora TaxID=1849047 RepID=A0A3D8QSJ6_9HELO|nr:beta-ketoacyl synthase-containing protein [Coleophoma cylindrospora]